MTNFICNKCEKKDVTTDGVRKHARKHHGQWVTFLKPVDYCRPCEPSFNFKDLRKLLYPLKSIRKMNDYEIMTLLTLGNDYDKDKDLLYPKIQDPKIQDPKIQDENDPDTWISNI